MLGYSGTTYGKVRPGGRLMNTTAKNIGSFHCNIILYLDLREISTA